MDQGHIHLIITHLPIFGSFLGTLILIYGILSKSAQVKIAAYGVLVISAIGAVIAYLTGEAAEELVEDFAAVSHQAIHVHEEAAFYAFVSMIVLGVLSLVALVLTLRQSPQMKIASFVVLVMAGFSFSTVARTGYLGGQIRHIEVAGAANAASEQNPQGDNDGD
jgi:uncharacterized membrane protein